MPSPVITPVFPLLDALASSRKQKVFLVGGALRDAHLGRSGRDLDFAVSSDAIALAMRMGAPISSSAEVMDQASIEIADDQDAEDSDPEETVQEFREFLEHISPEDFQ